MTLEKLLNILCEKGWKPRGYKDVYKFKLYKLGYTIARPQKQKMISFATETIHYINGTDYIGYKGYSIRELVSKESGLRQFVCEEGLVNYNEMKRVEYMHQGNKDYEQREYYNGWDDGSPKYEYRLIESALKDESELEEFLLDNIKVGDI